MVSFVVVRSEGGSCVIVEFSKNQYPTIMKDYFEM